MLGTAPVYNVKTIDEEETARLAFVAPTVDIPIGIPVSVRSGSDYGLVLKATSISQTVALSAAKFTIWGFPADHEHDVNRFHPGGPGEPPGCPGTMSTECIVSPYPEAGRLPEPFIDNPSVCTGSELPVSVEAVSYQDPNNSTKKTDFYPETTGCENQRFDPVFNLGLTTAEADAPSGLDIELRAQQFLEGKAPTPSNLRSATLRLPPGLTVNPDAADGQTSCSDAQAGFGENAPGSCPDTSKIGTVEVRTPALEAPLRGDLYIGEPQPGNQYRLFMLFSGFGINAKLKADVHPNPATGELTVTMLDLPQVPFESFHLHLFAGDRGLVATPTICRLYNASSDLVPWNGTAATQHSSPFVTITTGPNGRQCPGRVRPFSPQLLAGMSNPLAGAFSNFSLKLDRDDGDQFLGDLTFKLPPGFTGSLRGLSYCPDASIAAAAQKTGRAEQQSSSCPASSQIGTTNVAAGPGSNPFHAVGRMFLSGPFKGAPLSVAAITPALAGPYDYGVVVVRVALHIDPRTAQVSAASDTVPSIIGGIPIRMRSIRVNIDKPNFTINPTNCSPFSVDSQGIGDQKTVTNFSSYFQAVNCATLPFQPKMAIRQLGPRRLTQSESEAALRPLDPSRRLEYPAGLPDPVEGVRDRSAPSRQYLLEIAIGIRTVRRPSGDRAGDHRNTTARRALERARLRRVRVRKTAARRLHPRWPGDDHARGRIVLGQGRPPEDSRSRRSRCSDRPFQARPLRRQTGLSDQHPQPLCFDAHHDGGLRRSKRRPEDPEGEDKDRDAGRAGRLSAASAADRLR